MVLVIVLVLRQAKLALSVGVFAARPLAVDAVLVFLQALAAKAAEKADDGDDDVLRNQGLIWIRLFSLHLNLTPVQTFTRL